MTDRAGAAGDDGGGEEAEGGGPEARCVGAAQYLRADRGRDGVVHRYPREVRQVKQTGHHLRAAKAQRLARRDHRRHPAARTNRRQQRHQQCAKTRAADHEHQHVS
jgi:hypothetical protein